MIEGQSYGLTKIRRNIASWETKVATIEIPILRPRLPTKTKETESNRAMESTDTQEPAEGQPQLENLLYENELLKEDVQELREELQRWKEANKKQVTWGLETLVEVVDHLGNPHSISENEELFMT